MTFPKLKQLSDPRLSPSEIAALLEEHIGDGSNEFHCELACKSFKLIRNPILLQVVLATAACWYDSRYFEIVNAVIGVLRSEACAEFFSNCDTTR